MKKEDMVQVNERELFELFNKLPRNLKKRNSPEIYFKNNNSYSEDAVLFNLNILISKLWISSRVRDKYNKAIFLNEELDINIFREILDMIEIFDFKKKNNILSNDIIIHLPLIKYKSYIKQVNLLIHYDKIFSFFLNKKEFSYNEDLHLTVIEQINKDIDLTIKNEESYNPFIEEDFKNRDLNLGDENYGSFW